MKEITITAILDNLASVIETVDAELEAAGASMKAQMQIDVAVEELFVNIARYAYEPETGQMTLQIETGGDPMTARITFIDSGVPFDPTQRIDPDVTLSAQEREIGGLGIFMVKKSMDSMTYRRENDINILTITKIIG